MNKIVINKTPITREKDVYTDGTIWTYLPTKDMQLDIKDRLMMELIKINDDRFPIDTKSSVFLTFKTNRDNIVLPGLLKNTLDAMNRVLISDDKIVESVLCMKSPTNNTLEAVDIGLMNTMPIIGVYDTIESHTNILFHTNVETVLDDKYLPQVYESYACETTQENRYTDMEMRGIINTQYKSRPLEGRIHISVELRNKYNFGDLDNAALNVLVPMAGICFNDMNQIETLHIIKKISRRDDPGITVYFEESKISK